MDKLTRSGRAYAATLKASINPKAMLKRIFIVAAILSSMTLVSNVAAARETAEQVFTHHLKAFLDRNMEENLKDYTENSVVIIPNAIFKGKDQIRGLFAGLFAEFAKPGMTFKLTEQRVVDNVVYISWTAETADNVYEYASDTFIVVDGKFAFQTIALKVKAKVKAK
jgi:hypothetical protein